jgi:hypothetical protein
VDPDLNLDPAIFFINLQDANKKLIVALTETFRYLELCSTCLKEGLGRKPATNP